MACIQRYIDRQLGIAKWKTYDSALQRLRCLEHDEFNVILPTEESECMSPIFACKFAQKKGYEHILALANEDGKMAIHDTNNKEERFGKEVHHNAIFDLAWMPNEMKLVTVSGDHTARLVDVSNADVVVDNMFCGHTRSVKTIAVRQNDSSVFATGSRDGNIFVWDIRSSSGDCFVKYPDRTIFNAHFKKKGTTPTSKRKGQKYFSTSCISGINSITGLVFQDDETLVSCSAGDGAIKVWDLRKSYKNHTKDSYPKNIMYYSGDTTKCGFSNLIFDKDYIKLYANCLDNTIYCYNMATYNENPVMKYKGHTNNTFYVKSCLSGDGLYLLSGSSDQNAYIWDTKFSKPILKLTGHNAEVTCVAWCQDRDSAIVTCSDDMRHKIWRIGPEILPENWAVIGRGCAELCDSNFYKRKLHADRLEPHKKLKSCPACNYVDNKLCEICNSNSSSRKRLNFSELHMPLDEEKHYNDDHANIMENVHFCKKMKMDLNINANISIRAECSGMPCNQIDSELKLISKLSEANVNSNFLSGNSSDGDPINVFLSGNSSDGNPINVLDLSSKVNFGTPKSSYKYSERSPEYVTYSPTTNLPNFNIDGSAPHLHFSPQKRADKDWLTKMRVQRSFFRDMQEHVSDPTSPKVPKIDYSPRNKSAKKQRKSNRCRSPQSPLLKFFKVTNSSIMKDSQCVSKAHMNQTLHIHTSQ